MNKAIKKSKCKTHLNQAGISRDGAGLEPEIPNEPKGKIIDIHEGAGLKPGILDVSKVDSSDSEYESWGVSDDDDDQQSKDERTKSNDNKSIDLNKTDDEKETQEDEFVHTLDDYLPTDDETDDEKYDRINKEMYDDVNVELKDAECADEGKGDEEMIDAEKSKVLIVVKECLGTNLEDTLHRVIQKQTANSIREHTVPVAAVTDVLKQQQQPQKSTGKIYKNLVQNNDKTKSFNRDLKHMALFHALMKLILVDEDAMDKGVADKLKKRKPNVADRDEDPPAGSDQGLKRRKMSKDAKPLKKVKSTNTSKGTTKSQPKTTSKSAQVDETLFEAGDTQMLYNLREDTGKTDETPSVKADQKEWRKHRKTYITSLTKTKAAKYDLQGIEDMVPMLWSPVKVAYDRHALLVANVKVNNWYGYGHLEEIEVRRVDQKLYRFMEGDLPRLRLNEIEDMLLLIVRNKIFNPKSNVIVDLAAALRMFTRRIVILKRVEDLQHGVESYQKKLNISTP
nr:hypothetical protein [Tanacetum cinerariifolium]